MAQKISMKQLANEILNVFDILAFVSEEKIIDWKIETVISAGDLELKSKDVITAQQIENLKTIYILNENNEIIEGIANVISYNDKTGEYKIIARKFGDGSGNNVIQVSKFYSVANDVIEDSYEDYLKNQLFAFKIISMDNLFPYKDTYTHEDVEEGDIITTNYHNRMLGKVMNVDKENRTVRIMYFRTDTSIIEIKDELASIVGESISTDFGETHIPYAAIKGQLVYDSHKRIGVITSINEGSHADILTIAVPNIVITNSEIDSNKTSATYGHLITTLSDGRKIDAGNAMGLQGPKGDGFAISKIYESEAELLAETDPVSEGAMVALVTTTDTSTTDVNAYIYIRKPGYTPVNPNDLNDYIFFCDLSEATVIRGPEGPQGIPGAKGDTPIIATSPIAATTTMPAGTRITITTGTGAAAQTVSFDIYDGINGTNGSNGQNGADGVDGLSVTNVEINSTNHLIVTMSDNTTIDAGEVSSGTTAGGCVTLLGCFATAPATCAKGDMYYNTTTKKIQKATTANVWGGSSTPKENILYISKADKKVYSWTDGDMISYGGGDIGLSAKDRNALTVEQDGLYVEDLSQKVNQINIAQKTVNEALDHAEFKLTGNTSVSTIGQLIPFTKLIDGNMKLNESNHIFLKANHSYQIICNLCYQDTSKSSFANIEYAFVDDSNNKIIQLFQPYKGDSKFEFSSTIAFQYTPTRDCGLYMKTVNVYNVDIIEQGKTTLTIQEIGRVTTIDPVNYIDTTQGIQDVPVGTLINTEGPQNPDHYLLCNGAEYNIADYRDLAEAIKKVYRKYNYFGGDGINTFAVPKYVDTNKWFSPKQTSNSNPYNVSASSAYNGWQVWWGFNNNCTTSASNAWHSAVGSTTGHWVQIDFKTIKPLNGISMAPRPEGNYNVSRMPRDFDIMGSNDGTTWNIIKSYTGIDDYENYKYREFIFDRPEKYRYYRIANIVITGDCVNIADIHFLEAPEKYVYIKYQPTYFIGTINGYEERKTLIDTPVLITCTNGMLKPGTEISLSESLDNYDYVEVHVGADYGGNVFGKHVTRIPVSEIIYSPDKTEWMNTYQEWICDQNTSFALWYGFKDTQTLYIGRIQANVDYTPTSYRGCQVIKIIGIRNRFKIADMG